MLTRNPGDTADAATGGFAGKRKRHFPMRTPHLKNRLVCERVALVLLTTFFLLVFPKRHMFLDVSLALFALGLLALDTRYTKGDDPDKFAKLAGAARGGKG